MMQNVAGTVKGGIYGEASESDDVRILSSHTYTLGKMKVTG